MKRLFFIIFLISSVTFGQNTKAISQPEKDFETFWTTFKDNYAFFKLKGINWDDTYSTYRPLINKKTKEKELISIFIKMVEPLNDGHITISKGDEVVYKAKKASQFKQEFKGVEKEFWTTVDTTLQNNGFSKPAGIGPLFKNEHLYYFSQTPKLGYIRMTRCFGNLESLFDDKKEAEDTKMMLELFDNMLNQLSNTNAVIIDLRTNGGGHGGLELASRLVKTKTLTHYKSIKQKGSYDTFSEPAPQYISPNNGVQYLKQVFILTSDKTASSAEDITISLYKQDNVTTIGTNTSGMLSDMFSGELSNGLSFTLSNQVYYSTDKEILEDKGVPVAFKVINSKKDIENKIDPVITETIKLLTEKNKI